MEGKNLTSFRGVFGEQAELQPLTCGVAVGAAGRMATGTVRGDLVVWSGPVGAATAGDADEASGRGRAQKAHVKMVTAIAGTVMGGAVTGSNDGFIKVWDSEVELLNEFNLAVEVVPCPLAPAVTSLCTDANFTKILVATRSSDVIEIVRDSWVSCRLLSGHSGSGLAPAVRHPEDEDVYATGGSDGTVRLWSIGGCRELALLDVGESVVSLSWSPVGSASCLLVAGLGNTSVIGIAVDLPSMTLSKTKMFVQQLDVVPSSVRISMDGATLLIDGKQHRASDGASVDVEVDAGSFGVGPKAPPVEVDSNYACVFQS